MRHGHAPLSPRRIHPRRSAGAGFTLVEMMVVIAIVGLIMSLVFGAGQTLLPQQRLEVSASNLGALLTRVRSHAVFAREEMLFVYDLEANTYGAYLPYEVDEEGRLIGPGRTVQIEPVRLEGEIVIEAVRMADGELRDDGEVAITISPLGRVAPHDVLVVNPEFADVEVRTVRINGMTNTFEILEGRPEPEWLDDVHFR